MKSLGFLLFAVGFLVTVVAHGGDEAAIKKEQALLKGMWKIVNVKSYSEKPPDIVGTTWEFDKDGKTLTFTKDNETHKVTYKLNPAGKPAEIDLIPSGAKEVYKGIYQIEKDTLVESCVICKMRLLGQNRRLLRLRMTFLKI